MVIIIMTEAFAFTVSYSNGVYTVSQPTNNNLIFNIPLAKAEIQTHPSIANYFYFGAPSLLLDHTKITNITPVSRTATIAYIGGLALSTPVTFPSTSLDANGSVTGLVTSNGPIFALRVVAGSGQYIKLRELSAVTVLSLGTYSTVNIFKNPTNSGGTWSAVFAGSVVERNNLTGFTYSGGTNIWSGSLRSERGFNLSSSDPTLVNGDVIVVAAQLFATASVSASLNWNEKL